MTHTYETNDPRGWCGDPSRGAALGRRSIKEAPADFDGLVFIHRIELDAQGYDRQGTYFGSGETLFWVAAEDGTLDYVERCAAFVPMVERTRREYPHAMLKRGDTIRVRCGVVGCEAEHEDLTCDRCGFAVCSDHYGAAPDNHGVGICDDCRDEEKNDGR